MHIKLLSLDVRIEISHAISRVDVYSQGSRHCYLRSRSPVANSRNLLTGQSLERTVNLMRRRYARRRRLCGGITNSSSFQFPRIYNDEAGWIAFRHQPFVLHDGQDGYPKRDALSARVKNFLSSSRASEKTYSDFIEHILDLQWHLKPRL